MNITYELVDLTFSSAKCIQFRKDTHICSFGSLDSWEADSGVNSEKYLNYLNKYVAEAPYGILHAKVSNEIIGQTEFRVDPRSEGVGYVNLIYVVPEFRGTGASTLVHQKIISTLREKNCNLARLSVSPKNSRAVAFYLKQGWSRVDQNKIDQRVDLYEMKI